MKKTPGTDDFTGKFCQSFKEKHNTQILHTLFWKIEKEGILFMIL